MTDHDASRAGEPGERTSITGIRRRTGARADEQSVHLFQPIGEHVRR
jgi:hypothetical protein